MGINVVKAKKEDLPRLLEILEEARKNIAELGIDQWQKGSPSAKELEKDIEKSELYMAKEREDILGFCYIGFSGEPTYENIYDGAWESDNFGVIHRVAVSSESRGKGVFKSFVSFAETLARQNERAALKIDTHRGNYKMHNALIKNGFRRVGIIYLENGDERIAFEKLF